MYDYATIYRQIFKFRVCFVIRRPERRILKNFVGTFRPFGTFYIV